MNNMMVCVKVWEARCCSGSRVRWTSIGRSEDRRAIGWFLHYCVFSLIKKLCSTLSLFTGCINGYRRHTAGGNPAMEYHPIQGGVAILLVDSCYRNRVKLRLFGPLGLVVRLYLFICRTLKLQFLLQSIKQYRYFVFSCLPTWKNILPH